MARNLKKEYLKKLLAITTANGYKVDLANYIYNPNYRHEYPNLRKVIEETDDAQTISEVYYMKHYDGSGEYIQTTHTAPKQNDGGAWYIISGEAARTLETSSRFSLDKLVKLAEAL